MFRRFRPLHALAAVCLLLGAACGDDPAPAPHGLKTTAPASKPRGAPVEVGFDVSDGDRFVGTITYRTKLWQRAPNGAGPEVKQASATVVFELEQVFSVPGNDRPPTSDLRLTFTEADGPVADETLGREPVLATLEHERTGRAVTASLRLSGGTKAQQAEVLAMMGGLPLAGFGGSPSWLPDRPVRAGEAWPVEGFIRPRGMDAAVRQARQVGMAAPEPTLTGTVRVLDVRDGEDGKEVELEIDSLIEIQGEIRQGSERGTMSLGHRVAGTAVVSARTGLPISIDVKETQHNNVRAGGQKVERRLTNEYVGTVRLQK